MANSDGSPLTKIVSLRSRGKLEVSEPELLGFRKLHLEHIQLTPGQSLAEDTGGGHDKFNSDNAKK